MAGLELIVLAVGLSMDAGAAAICKGSCMRRFNIKEAVAIAVSFGLFQALMPLIGWYLGTQFSVYIQRIDHWIAMILLTGLGIKMIWEAIREKEDVACTPLDLRELMVLSVATSIDALAAGIAFAVLSTGITRPVIIIGLVTAALSMLGVMIGSRFGQTFRAKAQVAGGAVLCLIGIKILLDHLNI